MTADAARGQDAINHHIGGRLRFRRTLLGWSPERLAEAVGLTPEQVDGYERGEGRIGPGRLFELSQALSIPIRFLFDDEDEGAGQPVADSYEPQRRWNTVVFRYSDTLEMAQSYDRVTDGAVRGCVLALVRSLGRLSRPKPGADEEG